MFDSSFIVPPAVCTTKKRNVGGCAGSTVSFGLPKRYGLSLFAVFLPDADAAARRFCSIVAVAIYFFLAGTVIFGGGLRLPIVEGRSWFAVTFVSPDAFAISVQPDTAP